VTEARPAETLDVRGEVCPYPELRTRRRLEVLAAGDVLCVRTDLGAAVRALAGHGLVTGAAMVVGLGATAGIRARWLERAAG
jgi:hypothetical protein